jgi:hypothetical protein
MRLHLPEKRRTSGVYCRIPTIRSLAFTLEVNDHDEQQQLKLSNRINLTRRPHGPFTTLGVGLDKDVVYTLTSLCRRREGCYHRTG